MHEIKVMHWPPLPDDPQQAEALRAILKWPEKKRMAALRKAYGAEFVAMLDGLENMPDDIEKRQAIIALCERFDPIDHCKVLEAGLSA